MTAHKSAHCDGNACLKSVMNEYGRQGDEPRFTAGAPSVQDPSRRRKAETAGHDNVLCTRALGVNSS